MPVAGEKPVILEVVAKESKGGQLKESQRLFFLVLTIVEAVIILFLLSNFFGSQKKIVNLKLDLKKTQEELIQKDQASAKEIESLRLAQKELKDKIENLTAAKADAEAKLNDAKLSGDELSAEFTAAKKEKEEARKEFMLQLRKTESMLLAKLEAANEENNSLQNKLFKLTTLTQGQQEEPVGVELKKIVVKQKEKNVLEGKVMRIEPRYGFIISDLGEKQGLKLGANVDIYRGKMKIAEANINEIYSDMSFATIDREKTTRTVARGDKVIFKLIPSEVLK
ncbi:MAG: hypothetical protein V1650_04395 [Candidatus Omnitrophota bacterium]